MTKNNLLDWAVEALKNENFYQASRYYEEYAESMIFQDKEGAGFNFILAAQYDKESIDRALSLYRKAYKIFEQLNNRVLCADLLMREGHLHLDSHDPEKAWASFRESIRVYAEIVVERISQTHGTLEQEDRALIKDCLSKIEFCLKQIG